jgi:type 1 glutamine amidotransferase
MTVRRREFLAATGAALFAPAWLHSARAAMLADKKILFFTKSSGFQHSAITREGDELGHAEKVLRRIGAANGFEVVCSKDGRMFDSDKIGQWDGFVFYTTGDLTKPGTDKQPPMSEDGLKNFLEAIESGKAGFVGVHSATDTMGDARGLGANDPYVQMIGGQFNGHGAQQEVELIVTDPSFPGARDLPKTLRVNDEWYSQKYQPKDLHVIIAHNTATMQGNDYRRPNYPQTWAKSYGKGRVFHTSMGHREDVWDNPIFQNLVIGGLQWTTGLANADITPNAAQVTPGFLELEKD